MVFGGGKKQTQELEEKIELLSEENRLLRRKLRLLTGNQPGATLSMASMGDYLSMAGRSIKTESGAQLSITGLDAGYLIVDKQYRVTQVNSKMADLLGCDKSVAQQKKPLADVDNLDWAPQVLTTMLQDAEQAGENVPSEFEAKRPNIETGRDDYFHFKAVWTGASGTVTMENVTKLKRTREFFERLVSPNIVTKLLDSGDDPFLVEKRHMTVMFGDLRNFTKFCEAAQPEHVRVVFDEFFHAAMEVITRNEATLDKFVGDQVMAIFAAPVLHPGHAYQAVRVAVEMQQAMREVRQSWLNRGFVPTQVLADHPDTLKLGIGLNTGDMIVGLFGSDRGNQYTVLGHNVNLAARFCSHAGGDEILAGMRTLDDIKQYYEQNPGGFDLAIKVRSKGSITVKGVAEPVPIAVVLYDGTQRQ